MKSFYKHFLGSECLSMFLTPVSLTLLFACRREIGGATWLGESSFFDDRAHYVKNAYSDTLLCRSIWSPLEYLIIVSVCVLISVPTEDV